VPRVERLSLLPNTTTGRLRKAVPRQLQRFVGPRTCHQPVFSSNDRLPLCGFWGPGLKREASPRPGLDQGRWGALRCAADTERKEGPLAHCHSPNLNAPKEASALRFSAALPKRALPPCIGARCRAFRAGDSRPPPLTATAAAYGVERLAPLGPPPATHRQRGVL